MNIKSFFITGLAITAGVSIVITGVAATSFDRASTMKEELRLNHVEGKKDEAVRLASQLAQNPEEPFIQGTLQEELRGLDAKTIEANIEKAVKFVTGRKTEIYCSGQGLVEMTGEHNDGSTSRLVLMRSKRKLRPGSFALIEGGDWAYELSNSYRRPSVSELWMIDSTPTSFHAKEVRNRGPGKSDTGEYTASWKGYRDSENFGTVGDSAEPVPMYMAFDYQLWGNTDSGFRINFEPGFKDSQETFINGPGKDIILKSERVVGEPIPKVSVKDSSGVIHDFSSCMPVKYQITLKQLIERRLEVDGKLTAAAIQKVINKQQKPVRACYKEALKSVPNLRGTISVNWDVSEGSVQNVRARGRSLSGDGGFPARDKMQECLVEAVRSWKFPSAPDRAVTHVNYSFPFQP